MALQTSVPLRKSTPDEQQLLSDMELARTGALEAQQTAQGYRDEAQTYAEAAGSGIETTHGAVETRPTSQTFTNLAGQQVTIQQDETVWVLDEGRPVRYDPADPDADANGFVGVAQRFALLSKNTEALGFTFQDNTHLLQPHDVVVRSGIAYVVGKGGTCAAVDISDPANIKLIERRNDFTNCNTIEISGQYAYVFQDGQVNVINLTSIIDPGAGLADVATVVDPTLNRVNGAVKLAGYMFCASKDGYITVLDIRDPADPKLVGARDVATLDGFESPHDVAVYKDHIVTVNQTLDASPKVATYNVLRVTSNALRHPDVWSGPSSTLDSTDLNGANRVVVSNQYAYVAGNFSDSIGVVLLQDPNNISLATPAIFLDDVEPDGVCIGDHHLFVGANETLHIYDISAPTNPSLVAKVQDPLLDGLHDMELYGEHLVATCQDTNRVALIELPALRYYALKSDAVTTAALHVTNRARVRELEVENDLTVGGFSMGNHPGLAAAWICFNGVSGSVAIDDEYNVDSITRNAAGDYTITWRRAFDNAAYSVSFGSNRLVDVKGGAAGKTTASLDINTRLPDGTGTKDDAESVSIQVLGKR